MINSDFLRCPICGHAVAIHNSDLHNIWSVNCGNPQCELWHSGSEYANVDWNDVKATYRELAKKWNARVTVWRIEHPNHTTPDVDDNGGNTR